LKYRRCCSRAPTKSSSSCFLLHLLLVHQSESAHVRCEVGFRGISRLVLLALSSSDLTLACVKTRTRPRPEAATRAPMASNPLRNDTLNRYHALSWPRSGYAATALSRFSERRARVGPTRETIGCPESTLPDATVGISRKIEMHMPSDRRRLIIRARQLEPMKARGEVGVPAS